MAPLIPDIAPFRGYHDNVTGPGDQRPTAMQVIHNENLFGQLEGLNILITGGNRGLGRETARALHATGAQVIIAVAPGFDGEAAAREIEKSNEDDPSLAEHKISYKPIEVISLDLALLTNVKVSATEIKKKTNNRLNVLICNAGVWAPSKLETQDGFEAHFGINYLGHFLLFSELADSLIAGNASSPSFASRVVTLSSTAHRSADLDISQLPPTIQTGQEMAIFLYCSSKTELLWMANEIERRFGGKGVHGFSLNPGTIISPLTAHLGWDTLRDFIGKDVGEFDRITKSLEQGAATTTWAAVGKELEGKGGFYLDDLQVATPAVEGSPLFSHGYEKWAYDEVRARQLWDFTVDLLKTKGFNVNFPS